MNTNRKWFFVAILLIGTFIYLFAVIYGGIRSINDLANASGTPSTLPSFINQVILGIGGALATHFGAFLGITFSQGKGLRGLFDPFKALGKPDNMAGGLAIVYFLSLVVAIILWGISGFSENFAIVLKDLASTFIGVFAGALIVAFKS